MIPKTNCKKGPLNSLYLRSTSSENYEVSSPPLHVLSFFKYGLADGPLLIRGVEKLRFGSFELVF